MSHVLALGIAESAVVAHPEILAWATGWIAAALGFWLRAALPPDEESSEHAALAAGCCGL